MHEPLRVALPLGIGDCHWAVTKFRGLAELHDRPIHAYVNRSYAHETAKFLRLIPFVEEAYFSDLAPKDIDRELPKYKDERWSTREGSTSWNGFDYVMVPNGHLERGERLEKYFEDIPTDFEYPIEISDEVDAQARELIWDDEVLLYMSGRAPNRGFHLNTWRVLDWVKVVRLLNEAGVCPTIVGGNFDDQDYYDDFLTAGGRDLAKRSLIGQTSHELVLALIRRAGVWSGLNSGLGIMSAVMRTPTVMLWSDSAFRIPNVITSLHTNMKTSWLSPEQLETYHTFSFGSPDLTAVNLATKILEVRRC